MWIRFWNAYLQDREHDLRKRYRTTLKRPAFRFVASRKLFRQQRIVATKCKLKVSVRQYIVVGHPLWVVDRQATVVADSRLGVNVDDWSCRARVSILVRRDRIQMSPRFLEPQPRPLSRLSGVCVDYARRWRSGWRLQRWNLRSLQPWINDSKSSETSRGLILRHFAAHSSVLLTITVTI